jgi:MFS family permease
VPRALPVSSLLEAFGFALVGVGSGFPGAVIAMVAITSAEVVFNPAHQTAVAEVADPAHRGRTFGLVTFTQMVGLACAPLLGGLLLDAIGHHHLAMWSAIATIGVAQTVCFVVFLRRRRFAAAAVHARV